MDRFKFIQGILTSLVLVLLFVVFGLQLFFGDFNASKIFAETGGKNVLSASILDSISQNNPSKEIPYAVLGTDSLNLNAESAVSYAFSAGSEKLLFVKNDNEKLPIASITKLVSALVILDNYDLSQKVVMTPLAVSQPDKNLQFSAGEEYLTKDLLHFMLVRSSNEAAVAFSEIMGTDKFVALMNQKAREIGLSDTFFDNPSGLYQSNLSTVNDLVKLADYILKNKPLILEMTTSPEFDLYNTGGDLTHSEKNIDELLIDPSLNPRVIGGKTGETPFAKQCFLLVFKSPNPDIYTISAVLKSTDRFGDMRKIINWNDKSFIWQ